MVWDDDHRTLDKRPLVSFVFFWKDTGIGSSLESLTAFFRFSGRIKGLREK